MPELLVGTVTHYFSKIDVAVLSLQEPLSVGDSIHIRGHTTDLEEVVESMEVERSRIESAKPGDDVAIKVTGRVRAGDKVYRDLE